MPLWKRSDSGFVWLNIVFLGFVELVPYWTYVFNTNFDDLVGVRVYGIYMLFTDLSILLEWLYAAHGYPLVDRDIDEAFVTDFSKVTFIECIIMIVGVVGSYFNDLAGFIFFVGAAWFITASVSRIVRNSLLTITRWCPRISVLRPGQTSEKIYCLLRSGGHARDQPARYCRHRLHGLVQTGYLQVGGN